MTPNRLWYQSGQFERCIDDRECDFGKRIFSILYQQDAPFTLNKLTAMKKLPGVPRIWDERVKVMLAVTYLVNNQIKDVADTFNTIDGKVLTTAKDTWAPFYNSTYRFLYLLLTSDELLKVRAPKTAAACVIGDSHTIGLSGAVGFELQRLYVPAVVVRGLSNPSNNNFKQAITNAVTMAYAADRVYFSIGEIDSRGFVAKLAQDSGYWETMEPRWRAAIDSTYAFLSSLQNPMQEFGVIVPPPPSENIVTSHADKVADSAAFISECVSVTEAFRDLCREAAQRHKLSVIEYSASILTDDGLNSKDALLDHAHFKPSVYAKLAQAMVK